MKKNNFDERINKINLERAEMIELIKNGINNKKNSINSDIDDINLILIYDKSCLKEYNTIVKAKNLINSLLEQIAQSNNLEDIAKLRKKINYYINKIKKIIKERDLPADVLTNITNSTSYLRKDISKYVSYLKRENKLNEINKLNNSFNELNKEEINKLRKYLRNEHKYNKRILKNSSLNSNIRNKEEHIINDKYDPYKELLETEKDNKTPENLSIDKNEIIVANKVEEIAPLSELQSNINFYKKIYRIKEIESYDNKKLLSLFKNIPAYYWNKKAIKKMLIDYRCFLLNDNLLSYISYSKKRNSIRLALEYIFNKSNLSKREMECLYNHNLCEEWINDYFYPSLEKNFKLTKTI